MAEDLIEKLRAENASLISELKQGVTQLQLAFDGEKRKVLSDLKVRKHDTNKRTHARSRLDFRPKVFENSGNLPKPSIKTRRANCNVILDDAKGAVTSTPMVSKTALEQDGNLRQRGESARKNMNVHNTKSPKSAQKKHPKSILVTPDTRKTPRNKNAKVFFPSDCIDTKVYNEDNITLADKSFLGYDWIAGMLDIESENLSASENFFNEIKEFRRVNKDECVSNRKLVSTRLPENGSLTPKGLHDINPKKKYLNHADDAGDVCAGSTYTVDSRLLPVPIHGPYSQCPVCQSKPEPETEYAESYIRVSVPRSSLKSPYRVKPHRRKSFDPSDSVALAEHCLAGWQCARPTYAPGPDTLDLKSGIKFAENLPTATGEKLNTSYQRATDELLKSTVGMRYGLQLLEDRENSQRLVNTTAYPAF